MNNIHISDILVVMLACGAGCSSGQTNDRVRDCDCLHDRWIRGGSGVNGERINEEGCRRDRVNSGNVCDGDSDRLGLVLVTLSCGLFLFLTSTEVF